MKTLHALLCFSLLLFTALPSAVAQTQRNAPLDIQILPSNNGIEAWLVEDRSLPVITMKFSFVGGLVNDPPDKPGLAKLVSVLLDEGAGDLRSQAFQTQLTTHAIGLGFSPGRDAFHGSLRTTTQHRDLAFELLGMALNKPRFDADAIERMKNALRADLKTNAGDPAWLSARTFNGMVFEGHHYAQPGGGTLESLSRISRRDLQDFVRTQFSQNLLRVAIVGDISRDDAIALIEKTFGTLPVGAPLPHAEVATLAHAGKTILLPLDTPQTYIALALPGLSRTDKDWYTAVIMNYVLGGSSFDARLMREVREKRGLTYGIYTSLLAQKYAHVLQTTLSTSGDKVSEALGVIRAEMQRMAKEGISRTELENAKSYLTGSMPLELTTTSDIADTLLGLQLYGLSPDELATRNRRIRAVSQSDVRAMAARLLDTEKMTTVLVGKPEGIDVDILLDRAPGLGAGE